ncbi:MAG TPA: biopolymer transporter ExbD [bacterium]|nr:biopolymer transporter ExbD [bacterium]HPN44271.1 biopolymer transporter ExbD [bacterium]
MQFKEKKKKSLGLNITSLIDVMFILLLFYVVSSTFVEQPGMKLELPSIKSQEVTRVENLMMYISKEGEIHLGETLVTLETLPAEIERMIPEIGEKTLVLKADKATEHGLIVQIMDIAKRSGLKKIVIGTKIETQ